MCPLFLGNSNHLKRFFRYFLKPANFMLIFFMNATIIYMVEIKLSKVLQKELKARKITINLLAKECGIPVSVLHGWVNGILPSAKNLHHIHTLSRFLGLTTDQLLFNFASKSNQHTLFSSTFMDGKTQYKLTIEKVEDK